MKELYKVLYIDFLSFESNYSIITNKVISFSEADDFWFKYKIYAFFQRTIDV